MNSIRIFSALYVIRSKLKRFPILMMNAATNGDTEEGEAIMSVAKRIVTLLVTKGDIDLADMNFIMNAELDINVYDSNLAAKEVRQQVVKDLAEWEIAESELMIYEWRQFVQFYEHSRNKLMTAIENAPSTSGITEKPDASKLH